MPVARFTIGGSRIALFVETSNVQPHAVRICKAFTHP